MTARAAAASARRALLVVVVALGFVAVATPSRATFVREYTVTELWSLADCVIEAFVDSVRYRTLPVSGHIVTDVHLDVTVVHQGPCSTGPRVLTQAGGISGAVRLTIAQQPGFMPGEHVLLFLDEYPGMLFPVLALDQGKFTVTPGPHPGDQVFRNRLHGALDRDTLFRRLRPARSPR
jgi:hypothetical protein